MNGHGQNFSYLKKGTFEIPFFQRPYVWNEDNWKQLVDSIDDEHGKNFPYLGSIILKRNDENDPWLVIDGQQRLTTLSLFIKAFIDVYSSNIPAEIVTEFKQIIYSLGHIGMQVTYKPRITPSSVDKEEFDGLIDHDNQVVINEKHGLLTDAYLFFKKNFKKRNQDDLNNLGTKILETADFFIAIELGKDDDEQKIFNSVNDYGQRLTGADIVKNNLFQVLKNKSNDNLQDVLSTYNKYWDSPFYQNDRKDFWYEKRTYGRITQINLEEFLKDFALIKGFYRSTTKVSLSEAYRIEIQNKCPTYNDVKDFIKELAKYADSFYDLISDYESENDYKLSENINVTLLILNELECTTFIPLILKIYNEDIEDKNKYLFAIQKFIIERLIYNASNKNYNKNVEVLLDKATTEEAIEYLEKVNRDDDLDYVNYPSGLLNINNQRATVILFLIEMIRRNKYGEERYSDTLIYNKTLEHIMPQKWEKSWSTVECVDYDANGDYVVITNIDDMRTVRKKSIYSIGNMTLLTSKLNTSISNSCFEEKIEGKIVRKKQKEGIRKFVGTLSVASEVVDVYDSQTHDGSLHIWNEKQINARTIKLFEELNSYFNFTDKFIETHTPILRQNYEKVSLDMNNVIESISDEFLREKRIAVVVTECMKYLFKNNLLTNQEIINLQNKQYCSETFICWMPMLATETDKLERYYKDKIAYNGQEFMITKEWVEKNREKFIIWFKNIIKH